MRKHNVVCLYIVALVIASLLSPLVSIATDTEIYYVAPEANHTTPSDTFSASTHFEEKTPAQRAALPKDEQDIINSIETYLKKQVNPYSRTLTDNALNRAFVDLAFEFGFKRNNLVFNNLTATFKGEQAELNWYEGLSNCSTRSLQVFDQPTKKQLIISAEYIDNQSATTVVVHHGYRSSAMNLLAEAKFFSDLGYNVLIPNARSHGKSEGEYITFGLYEKEDLTQWLNQEVADKPQQDIYLYGVSMGAATVMLSQEKPHPNVKGIIEDCGYSSVEEQFRSMIRLLTDYIQYIPGFNLFDWYRKETTLLNLLNDRHLKPTLNMDLYTVSPLESVKRSGLPSFFIHGDADWFIRPHEKETLFNHAIGYKERLTIANAGHAEAFHIGGALYKEAVISFIETVTLLETTPPVVADDVNLLKNPNFNFSATSFNDWGTSRDGKTFSLEPLNRNSYGEFVLANKNRNDLVTLTNYNNGIRFFNRYIGSTGYVGQDVPVVAGETYELSFTAQNTSAAHYTYPRISFGFNQDLTHETFRRKTAVQRQTTYTATNDQPIKVTLGASLAYRSWIDHNYTHTAFSQLRLINNDRTPPHAVTINSLTTQGDRLTIKGQGEAHTTILISTLGDQIINQVTTDGKGFFTLIIDKELDNPILHLVNVDVKGNISASKMIVFQ